MPKIKPFTGMRKCPDGEIYRFKKGVAKVPGCWFQRKTALITIKEFNDIVKELR